VVVLATSPTSPTSLMGGLLVDAPTCTEEVRPRRRAAPRSDEELDRRPGVERHEIGDFGRASRPH